jgi:hypothetical protein
MVLLRNRSALKTKKLNELHKIVYAYFTYAHEVYVLTEATSLVLLHELSEYSVVKKQHVAVLMYLTGEPN